MTTDNNTTRLSRRRNNDVRCQQNNTSLMASFGWKKKVGEKVSKSTVLLFESEAEKKTKSLKTKAVGDDDEEEADWLHATKRRRETLLEDCTAKSKRLKDEGAFLAQQGRHWEAIKKWDEAIQLTPDNASLYEMKSQVLTILQEVFPAVKAAEMAVKCRPVWWEGWQTLGRAQVNMGEVDLAVRSFQVAVHLCPSERALWQDDLAWAQRLQRQHRESQEKRLRREEEEAHEQALDVPELQRDYEDFESDEVLAACTAVAERQRRYEEMKERTIVVVLDADGNAREEDAADIAAASVSTLVKARGP